MEELKTLEIPIEGMDCAECTQHVKHAIEALPGVRSANVLLATEKAIVTLDLTASNLGDIRTAVAGAGYSVPQTDEVSRAAASNQDFTRSVLVLLGIVFGAVLFVVVVGEWLGFFEAITRRVPYLVGLGIVLLFGYPVFRNVVQATLHKQVISHTLMTLGVLAALAVGEWATAAVVVFFMRVGDYVESFTTDKARRAVKDLVSLAPQVARVERHGQEFEVPVEDVAVGEIVVVRPGEKIPVDGEVVGGQATIDQAAITGEPLPVEAGPGAHVYAATIPSLGGLRVRTQQVGANTTFGRVIRLVEQAESNRGKVGRIADQFSAWYLPVVAGLAAITFLIRRDPLASAAVLVVACSCSFALATPIAVLASIGAAARRGLMIKGGAVLESLARADVLLIDKTGTLTLGKAQIQQVVALHPEWIDERQLLRLAASLERYSEHPLAAAVRQKAAQVGIPLQQVESFEATPGRGVSATVDGRGVIAGNQPMMEDRGVSMNDLSASMGELTGQGATLLLVAVDRRLAGVLVATDTLRPEVPQAMEEIRSLGIRTIELLSGDRQASVQALVQSLGGETILGSRAELLPEDKIAVVKEYQARGHVVVMVGDGVNDAPALAQADVGIAMGAAGSDVAIQAAHAALMREDWLLVPQLLRIARRTMYTVRGNLAFTIAYNLIGLSLAALGFLPPVLAAAAQSVPDLGILANSSRLIRQKP